MRRWLVVLVVLTVACTQGGQSAVKSPSPTLVSSPAASPSPVPGDLPLSHVSFSCRLPVSFSTSIGAIPNQSAFIAFPSASVTIDPSGKGGAYFDRAFSRWLTVGRNAVSPDGAHYAYVDLGDQGVFYVHVVDVLTGRDRALTENGNGFSFQPSVFDYATEGIFIVQAFERIQPGLWLVDPATGSMRQVSSAAGLQLSRGGGIFWTGDLNPADPNPVMTGSSAGTLPDQIDRLDIRSGGNVTWLYRPGRGFLIVGLDVRGHPLIDAYAGNPQAQPKTDPIDHSATELMLALDPTTQMTIYKGTLVETLGGAISDSHGIWFGSPQGIYLFTSAGGLQKVSNQPGYPANGCL
jgi:hypothetical protein